MERWCEGGGRLFFSLVFHSAAVLACPTSFFCRLLFPSSALREGILIALGREGARCGSLLSEERSRVPRRERERERERSTALPSLCFNFFFFFLSSVTYVKNALQREK